MTVCGGMLQFILKFFQTVFREQEKKPDALVGVVLRIADFVGLDRGKVIFLLLLAGVRGLRSAENQTGSEKNVRQQSHGCFSELGCCFFKASSTARTLSRYFSIVRPTVLLSPAFSACRTASN